MCKALVQGCSLCDQDKDGLSIFQVNLQFTIFISTHLSGLFQSLALLDIRS